MKGIEKLNYYDILIIKALIHLDCSANTGEIAKRIYFDVKDFKNFPNSRVYLLKQLKGLADLNLIFKFISKPHVWKINSFYKSALVLRVMAFNDLIKLEGKL